MIKRKKGMQSFDFIVGMVIFLGIVVYIAFSVVTLSNKYLEKADMHSLQQRAWILSQDIVHNITNKTLTVNNTQLEFYKDCPGNLPKYTHIREKYNLSIENAFRLTFISNPVVLATMPQNDNYLGKLQLVNTYDATFTKSSGEYSQIIIGGITYDDNQTSATPTNILLESVNYTIVKIDRSGQYAILENVTASCGISPPLKTSVVSVKRFLVKDNQLFALLIEYW